MNERATKKQQELLQFIDGCIKGNGYGPSYREIMRALGYKSVSTVAVHIDSLIAKGYLRKRDRSARSIEVVSLRTPSQPATPAADTAEHIVWLEAEIARRLQSEDLSEEDRAVLEKAGHLLGVPEHETT